MASSSEVEIKAILSEYAWPSSFCFLSYGYFFTANNYHHHVAINTWMGTNILPANNSNNKPGLDHYAVKLSYFKEKEMRFEKPLEPGRPGHSGRCRDP